MYLVRRNNAEKVSLESYGMSKQGTCDVFSIDVYIRDMKGKARCSVQCRKQSLE
jgi:hypothetical protein